MKILLADDEIDLGEILKDVLVGEGHEVHFAENGTIALKLAQEAGPFDALITDVNMPQIKGPELAKKFSSLFPKAKICVISGHIDIEDERENLFGDLEITILSKPFSTKELIKWANESSQ